MEYKDAYILNPNGEKIIDFNVSNLHVVNYSIPVNKEIDLEDLQSHLHSIKNQPDAVPVTPTIKRIGALYFS